MRTPVEDRVSFCQMGPSTVWGGEGPYSETGGKETRLRDWGVQSGQEVTIVTLTC